jgi:predicted Zn-dependent peptidase
MPFQPDAHPAPIAFRLNNGIRVILAPQNDIQAACVMVYHLTGVRDDPPGIFGASYLYEKLMLSATRNLEPFDRSRYIDRCGGLLDHIVNYDNSIFYQVVPDTELNHGLWMESERISSLKLGSGIINAEKNRVYSYYYRAFNKSIYFRAGRWVNAQLFRGTPYEIPKYGKLDEIRSFDNRSIAYLYNNFRDLSRIILVIAGKFQMEEIKKSVKKHFFELSSPTPTTPTTAKKEPQKTADNSNNIQYSYVYQNWFVKNLQEPFVIYGIRGPAKYSNDYLYFDFIRFYLLDRRISKLDEILKDSNNLDVFVQKEFTDYFDANALVIRVHAKRQGDLERAKYLIDKKIDSLVKGRPGAISSSDLKAVKSLMEIDYLKQMMVLERRCRLLAENYYLFGSLDAGEIYLERLREINVYDIYRTARKYLVKDNRVKLNVLPKPETSR